MFRAMRRANRAIDTAEAWEIVDQADYGILSMVGDGGYPYGIPMSHVRLADGLAFHAGVEGHKLDALDREPRACYTVVQGPLEEDSSTIAPDSMGTFRSAVLFGRVRRLPEDRYEELLRALCARYTPDAERREEIYTTGYGRLCVLLFEVDHISGKKLDVK